MPANPITLIIADDHALLIEGIKAFLSKYENYHVIGEASDGSELIEKAKRLNPDIIITDIQMPKTDGIIATKHILKHDPAAKIIAMSFLDTEAAVVDMLEAGAKGYVYKGGNPIEMINAINFVSQGQHYFCIETKPSLIKQIAKSKNLSFNNRKRTNLSDREIDIIKMICNEYYPNQIADELNISKRTVDVHLHNIYKKLGVNNVVGLFAFAVRNSIVYISKYKNV